MERQRISEKSLECVVPPGGAPAWRAGSDAAAATKTVRPTTKVHLRGIMGGSIRDRSLDLSLSPGARLGPYEIVVVLGVGGMGEVYKARDTRLDRTVAIKVLPSTLAADPAFLERFDREARAISSLNHPQICTLHDVGVEPGSNTGSAIHFLVMEFVDGDTLAARLARGAVSCDQSLRWTIAIAEALDAAHRAGIVHRDLKPGNIMLTKSGIKLLDFGLAKVAAPALASVSMSAMNGGVTVSRPLTAQGTWP